MDTSQGSPTTPALPAGHPFNVQPTPHWSATSNASDASRAWAVGFATGNVFRVVRPPAAKCGACVAGRGLMGFSDWVI